MPTLKSNSRSIGVFADTALNLDLFEIFCLKIMPSKLNLLGLTLTTFATYPPDLGFDLILYLILCHLCLWKSEYCPKILIEPLEIWDWCWVFSFKSGMSIILLFVFFLEMTNLLSPNTLLTVTLLHLWLWSLILEHDITHFKYKIQCSRSKWPEFILPSPKRNISI